MKNNATKKDVYCPFETFQKLLHQSSNNKKWVWSSFSDGEVFFDGCSFFIRENVAYLVESFIKTVIKNDENGNEYVDFEFISKENCFDFSTGVLNEEIPKDDIEQRIDTHTLTKFCIAVASNNKYLMGAIKELLDNRFLDIHHSETPDYRKGKFVLYKLCTSNQVLFEKLLKTNPNILYNRSAFCSINVEEKNVKKALGIPTSVVEELNKNNRQYLIPYFQILCNDGNDANIILKFLNNPKTLTKRKRNLDREYEKMFSSLADIKSMDETYTISELFRYVLNQTMYHAIWDIDGLVETCGIFRDYINMKIEWEIKERFPSNIYEAHDILSRNVKGYTDVEEAEFEKVSASLCYLETKITMNKGKSEETNYSFIIPKTVKDLITEGVQLHHCIGTWGRKIINRETKIVFMRLSDNIDSSLATLEIDDDGNVIQAKVNYNEDIPFELSSVIKSYEGFLKKIMSI